MILNILIILESIQVYLGGGMDEENGTYTLSAYLIAQLGKNFKDGANEKITGEQLLQAAVDTIKELQYMAGGMVIFLHVNVQKF